MGSSQDDTTISTECAVNAIDDDFTATPVNGSTGGTAANVLDNDEYLGEILNPDDFIITPNTNGPLTVNADGTVDVAPGTAPGTYTVDYTICQDSATISPANCDTATVTVLVEGTAIDAVAETFATINGEEGGTTTVAILDSDTLGGAPAVSGPGGNVTLTVNSIDAPLTLNPDGTITIAPNTPAGDYEINYTICENAVPTNCDTVTETITVAAPAIDAVAETIANINGADGGTTQSILTSDTFNMEPAVSGPGGNVTLTVNSISPEITLNPDNTIIVPAGTPAGIYTVNYTICDNDNPTNCDTVTETVTVDAPIIDAVAETFGNINGFDGGSHCRNDLRQRHIEWRPYRSGRCHDNGKHNRCAIDVEPRRYDFRSTGNCSGRLHIELHDL